jgi:RimJ/RimL family protein N-acetyltransferase
MTQALHPTKTIFETERLRLRTLNAGDAVFFLRLVNDPSFIKNIRDKGIRTIADAENAIQTAHRDVQERLGFSLYLVERKEDQQAIGLCGLVQRDELPGIDIGYAYLPEFGRKGYAYEANQGLLKYAKQVLSMQELLAIVSPHNLASSQLLEKLGFQFESNFQLAAGDTVKLYRCLL